MPMLVTISATVLLLLSVMVCGDEATPTLVEANARLAGENTTAFPVPPMDIVCGEPDALSATLSAAVRVPDCAGLKVMAIVQLVPAATLVPQVFVSLKELAFVPVMPMLDKVKAA